MGYERIDELVKLGKIGDKKALLELLGIYDNLVKKYVNKYFIKGYDDEDLRQMAHMWILYAVQNFDLNNGSNFTGYVDITFRNMFTYMIRKKENCLDNISLESTNDEGMEFKEMLADDFNLEEFIVKGENRSKLKKAISKLTQEERELVGMVFSKHGGLKDYVEKMGITYMVGRRRRDKVLKKIRNNII